MKEKEKVILSLKDKVEEISTYLEKMKVTDYINIIENPHRLAYKIFLSGISRGFGLAIGFAILGAIIIIVLRKLALLNLPVIGGLIARLIKLIQVHI